MPMWHIPARHFAAANSRLALGQIATFVRENNLVDAALVDERRKAHKISALAVHPKGAAAEADDLNVSFEPAADLPGVAAAVAATGAFAANVTDPAELPGVLTDALAAVHSGRSAVVAAHLPGV